VTHLGAHLARLARLELELGVAETRALLIRAAVAAGVGLAGGAALVAALVVLAAAALAPSFGAVRGASAPWNLPIGVRVALTMTGVVRGSVVIYGTLALVRIWSSNRFRNSCCAITSCFCALPRVRTATVPASASRPPITARYGTLCSSPSRTL